MDLKTSDKWRRLFPELTIIKPDGWDRENYTYSFFTEEITIDEYCERIYSSTVKGNLKEFIENIEIYKNGKMD